MRTQSSGKEHGSRGSRPIPPIDKRSEVRGVGRSDARLARSEARLQVTAALEPVPSETRTNEMAFPETEHREQRHLHMRHTGTDADQLRR